jgi:flavodoxin
MTPASPLLVVYYSRSGTTARVGHALAQRLGADELAIEDARADGSVSVWRATLDRLLNTLPPIAPIPVPLESYELVVLGTPVWGARAASPVRRFLHDFAPRLPEVAFFCTMGGSGAQGVFADMQERLGKAPRATCALDAKALGDESYLDTLDTFAAQLADGSRPLHHRAPASSGIQAHL